MEQCISDVTHHENNSSIFRLDAFLSTNTMSPNPLAISYPPSVRYHLNIDSSGPFTIVVNDLHSELISPFGNVTTILSSDDFRPVPSPLNNHSECNDSFCCQHEPDYFTYESMESVDTTINESIAASSINIRNRGKNTYPK